MRILVRGTNWIGDAVMTIPAITKLRTLFPDAKMTLQTRQGARDVLLQTGLFDEIITPTGFAEQVMELRRRRFDLAVIFPNSFSSALTVRLAGVMRTFGYATDRRSFLLTDPIAIPEWRNSRHEVYYYLGLIDEVEARITGRNHQEANPEPSLNVSEVNRNKAGALLRTHGIDSAKKLVALAPGSTNSRAKRWIPERFAELNDRLQSELDCNVLLLGSKDDKEISRTVVELSRIAPVDLTGATDIETAAGVLSRLDLLISNDMGLAHLAPAVGTETIVIFGPTNQATTAPMSRMASIISANVECAPCMLRDCPIDHRCMTRISVDDVFGKAKEKLYGKIHSD